MSDTGVSVHSGFPNAADDARLTPLDLHALLVPQPRSTFLFTAEGDEFQDLGITAGDIVVIDRALVVKPDDLIAWVHNDGFVLGPRKQLPMDAEIWGVVTATIHRQRQGKQHE